MPEYRAVQLDHFPKSPYGFGPFPDGSYFAIYRGTRHLGNLFSANQEDADAVLELLSELVEGTEYIEGEVKDA